MGVTGTDGASRDLIDLRAHAVHSFSRRQRQGKRLYALEISGDGDNQAHPINYY